MSAAKQIFYHIKNGGWSEVEAQVTNRRIETLHLDFKRKASAESSLLDRDDRKNLSIALSGFANSDGGVLVWGVDARRIGDHDCATEVYPLQSPDEFVGSLHGAIPELVSPFVPGVEHEIIRSDSGAVVLTLVPSSDGAPHMATGPSLHRYYRRNGSSFWHLEHYEIADLFGRRPQARMTATSEWDVALSRYSAGHSGVARLSVRILIKNEGKGLARYPSLSLREIIGWDLKGLPPGVQHLPRIAPPRGWSQRYAGGTDVVVYPDDELLVAEISTEIKTDQSLFPDLRMVFRVQADGTPPEDGELVVNGEDIRTAAIREFERQNLPYHGKNNFGPRVN